MRSVSRKSIPLLGFLILAVAGGVAVVGNARGSVVATLHGAIEADLAGCAPLAWSEPKEWIPRGSVAPMMMVGSHRREDGAGLVLGADVDFGAPLPRGAATIFSSEGGRLGTPGGWLAYPRGDFDSDGRFHLVWGEPDGASPGPPQGAFLKSQLLLHSTYTAVGGWSSPDTVLATPHIGWGPVTGTVRADPPAGVSLVVPVPPDTLLQINLSWGGAQSTTAFAVDGAIYTDWVTTRGGRRFLGYISRGKGPDPLPASAGNSVFIRRFLHGRWEPADQVQLSVEGRATEVRLLATDEGTLVMMWGQGEGENVFSSKIRLLLSSDEGASWSQPYDLTTDHRAGYSAAADSHGNVHAVWFVAHPGDHPLAKRLMYACWDGNWSSAYALFDDTFGRGLEASLGLTPGGTFELLWSHVSDPSDPGHTATLLRSEAPGQ